MEEPIKKALKLAFLIECDGCGRKETLTVDSSDDVGLAVRHLKQVGWRYDETLGIICLSCAGGEQPAVDESPLDNLFHLIPKKD